MICPNPRDKWLSPEKVLREHENLVKSLCRRFSRHPEDAKELAQDIYCKIVQALPGFKGESAISTWVYRIALNHCYHYLKGMRSQSQGWLAYWASLQENDYLIPHEGDNRLSVQKFLEPENEATRKTVELHFMEGYTQDEIAQTLKVSRVAVTKRLGQFKERCRRRATKWGLNQASLC